MPQPIGILIHYRAEMNESFSYYKVEKGSSSNLVVLLLL